MTNTENVTLPAVTFERMDDACQKGAGLLAGKDWHSLSRAEQEIERLLIWLKYLTPTMNGFVGSVIPRGNTHLNRGVDFDSQPDFDPADLSTPTSPGFDFNT